jgi:hypothetical protein
MQRMLDLYIPPDCKNIYSVESALERNWTSKRSTAVFRGSFTGSSGDVLENPRLHVASLNRTWAADPARKLYLDAGVTDVRGASRPRKSAERPNLEFANIGDLKKLVVPKLDYIAQSKYKYIIYIEGNVAAYRGAFMFAMQSVVIWVKSLKFHLWFEPRLEHKKNCMLVEHDLSDLEETIEWLRAHDDDAGKIAAAGRALYDELLQKDSMLDYMQYVLNHM